MMIKRLTFFLFFLFACTSLSSHAAPQIACVNIDPAHLPSFASAARQAGLSLAVAHPGDSLSGPLVLWQATAGADIDDARADALDAYVRGGGNLVVSLSDHPGTGVARLSFLLPAVPWETMIVDSSRGKADGEIGVSDWDKSFFPAADLKTIVLPFHFRMRPIDAVERGRARYEQFQNTLPMLGTLQQPGQTYWSRPLIDRDWQVRIAGNDGARTPLLITGRYGAGRVAILAGSIASLESSADAAALDAGLLAWLFARDSSPALAGDPPKIAPAVGVDVPGRRLRVTLANPTASPMTVEVLARLETWEQAPIGDIAQTVTLAANAAGEAVLPIPPVGSTSYQALEYCDAYHVRVGVLSANGQLLGETAVNADLRPAVSVSLDTDDLKSIKPPFDSPGPSLQNSRMGLPLFAYAYAPGQALNARVTVAYGVRDIAPLAQARDETQPDNPSVPALTDQAAVAGKTPIDGVKAYGMWSGAAGVENVLSLTFPHPVTLSSIVLIGVPADDTRNVPHNPAAATIELDGATVASSDDLDAAFASGYGRASFVFAPRPATVLRVRLPWRAALPDGAKRAAPWLGEVEVNGTAQPLEGAVSGKLAVTLFDGLSGQGTIVAERQMTVPAGESQSADFTLALPKAKDIAPLRLEARFTPLQSDEPAASARRPLLVISPSHPLTPITDLFPPSAPYMGFIVTRGFRNASDLGTGTQESHSSWEEPDDLIWAYSHRAKQTASDVRTMANRLYVTDSDMRHYSTPWDLWPDGETYYASVVPNFVAKMSKMRNWSQSDIAVLGQGDRWDSGPSVSTLYNWQDFIGFDDYLKGLGLPGLKGRTRPQICEEIDRRYPHQWQAYLLQRYVNNLRALRSAFAAAGKRIYIQAQGIPITPMSDEDEIAAVVRGTNDDSTWGMTQESIPLTTGRQMAYMAFDPAWGLDDLMHWGWDSAILNFGFHTPVGTTEPSRRHTYDRAWRGVVSTDGVYRSMHAYGYNRNGGEAFTMTQNDWQQWWQAQERHSLIAPEAPLGLGVVLSTALLNDPAHTEFSGGGMGGSPIESRVMDIAGVVNCLQDAGLSVPFSANMATIAQWKGDAPLLLLNVGQFSAPEIAALKAIAARGVRLAAFAGEGPLPPEVASLFGVAADGQPISARPVAAYRGKQALATEFTLLIPGGYEDLSDDDARVLAPLLAKILALPVTYPEGTEGYAFKCQGDSMIEIEDWMDHGRTVPIRLRASSGAQTAQACELDDHQTLPVHRDGPDWIIDLPLRPGDGDLVCVRESAETLASSNR